MRGYLIFALISSIILVLGICNQKACGQSNIYDVLKINKTKDFVFKKDGIAKNWSKTKWVSLPQIKGQKAKGYFTRVKVLYSSTGIYFEIITSN